MFTPLSFFLCFFYIYRQLFSSEFFSVSYLVQDFVLYLNKIGYAIFQQKKNVHDLQNLQFWSLPRFFLNKSSLSEYCVCFHIFFLTLYIIILFFKTHMGSELFFEICIRSLAPSIPYI